MHLESEKTYNRMLSDIRSPSSFKDTELSFGNTIKIANPFEWRKVMKLIYWCLAFLWCLVICFVLFSNMTQPRYAQAEEISTEKEKCLHQVDLWVHLWSIFLMND